MQNKKTLPFIPAIGQKLTIFSISDAMAHTIAREIQITRGFNEKSIYKQRKERGGRLGSKEYQLRAFGDSDLVFDGWEVPILVESEVPSYGGFKGDANLNITLVSPELNEQYPPADAQKIRASLLRTFIEENNLNPAFTAYDRIILIGATMDEEGSPVFPKPEKVLRPYQQYQQEAVDYALQAPALEHPPLRSLSEVAEQHSPEIQSLISGAAEAIELYSEDELEEYAAGQRKPGLPPLPWTRKDNRLYASDGEEIIVATNASPRYRKVSNETAEAIRVRVNSHDALVAALRYPLEVAGDPLTKEDDSDTTLLSVTIGWLREARAALTLAEGKEESSQV